MAILYNPQNEGKGISKLTKRSFSHCLSVLFSKIFLLIKTNVLFCLFILPLVALSVLIAFIVFPDVNLIELKFQVSFVFQIFLIPLPLAFVGPASCGLTKVTRDIGREEHVDLVKDFFVTYKRCFFKSIIVSFLQYLFYIAAFFAFIVYWGEWLFFGVSMIAMIYFTLMQKYIHIMLVSTDLSVFKMYKNAILLVLAGFKKSMAILLITIVFTMLLILNVASTLYVNLALILTGLYLLLIHFSVASYFENYYAFDVIIKYVVEPFYNENKESNESKKVELGEKYTDNSVEKEKSEYVYVNGKLVKREIAETENIFNDDK